MAEQRKRLDAVGIAQAVSLFTRLPVLVDSETDAHAGSDTLASARRHALSVYDAAYLELASRRGAMLASLDLPLPAVAGRLKAPLLPKKWPGES
jgi:predicted nucleic acid-binding protein